MKSVETICDFELLEPFQSRNAGFSVWTFARRDGRDYFLKQFLDPVYPVEDPEQHKAQMDYCQRFEQEKRAVYRAIAEASDGNLIRPECFFRSGTKYYLAMDKVEAEKKNLCELCQLPKEDAWLVCLTAAHALMCLHEKEVVHSDIKPDNLILHKSEAGKYVAKLVDFDASFFSDHPPAPEQVHFDEAYLAPETALYLMGEYDTIECSADVFSMGLLFHQILAGELPGYDHDSFSAPFEAVFSGTDLALSSKLLPKERKLLEEMLRLEPSERCTMSQVYEFFAQCLGVPQQAKTKKRPVPKLEPASLPHTPKLEERAKAVDGAKGMAAWFHPPES